MPLYAYFVQMSGFYGPLSYCPQYFVVHASSKDDAKTVLLARLREKGMPNITDLGGPYAPQLKDLSEDRQTSSYRMVNEETLQVALDALLEEIEKGEMKELTGDVVYFSALDG
jgi:hypothetical protein